MINYTLITVQILLVIVAPLLLLYLRGPWPRRSSVLCMVAVPVMWYPLYAPLHELGHVAGTYLALGTVVDYRLVPRFWEGGFGHAWIKSEGLRLDAQWLISTSFPYLLDLLCIAAAYVLLRPESVKRPFWVGFLFMLLCLRPAFDFVFETVAFVRGGRGDIFYIETIIGTTGVWAFLVTACAASIFSIAGILDRYRRPQPAA